MINTKELMRGNLISTPQGLKQVSGFQPGREVATIYLKDGTNIGSHMCNPIPLTPEWLVKCGFEMVKEDVYRIEADALLIGIALEINGDNPCMGGDYQALHYIHPKIKYIHQLQNLYFALTGQELDIKF